MRLLLFFSLFFFTLNAASQYYVVNENGSKVIHSSFTYDPPFGNPSPNTYYNYVGGLCSGTSDRTLYLKLGISAEYLPGTYPSSGTSTIDGYYSFKGGNSTISAYGIAQTTIGFSSSADCLNYLENNIYNSSYVSVYNTHYSNLTWLNLFQFVYPGQDPSSTCEYPNIWDGYNCFLPEVNCNDTTGFPEENNGFLKVGYLETFEECDNLFGTFYPSENKIITATSSQSHTTEGCGGSVCYAAFGTCYTCAEFEYDLEQACIAAGKEWDPSGFSCVEGIVVEGLEQDCIDFENPTFDYSCNLPLLPPEDPIDPTTGTLTEEYVNEQLNDFDWDDVNQSNLEIVNGNDVQVDTVLPDKPTDQDLLDIENEVASNLTNEQYGEKTVEELKKLNENSSWQASVAEWLYDGIEKGVAVADSVNEDLIKEQMGDLATDTIEDGVGKYEKYVADKFNLVVPQDLVEFSIDFEIPYPLCNATEENDYCNVSLMNDVVIRDLTSSWIDLFRMSLSFAAALSAFIIVFRGD
jgi:hypothetical protein